VILAIEHSWPIGCGLGGVAYGRWTDDFVIV
jgi:hypothetical protein